MSTEEETKAPETLPKVEDPTAAAVAAAAATAPAAPTAPNPEALAAAAAAAVTATADAPTQPPPTPLEVASPTPGAAQSRVSLLNEVDGQGKRRFFPRVKHLISNKEWEDFLTQVLQCIEEAGAPEAAAASHKANNAWYKAFDLIYGGVAREYSIPTGKNRYHKFKDKILEVWVALEGQAPGENHCRDLAMEQYDRYKRACAEASKNGSSTSAPVKASKTGAGQSASGSYKLAGGKRSYSTAMGGAASLPISSNSDCLWKGLDETAVMKGLPAKLQSLVHLKQLSKEMVAGTTNRAARKGIEEHCKKLDGAYMEALSEFLGEDDKAEESADVEMTDGDKPDEKTDEEKAKEETEAYNKCLIMAFLYRYASTLNEQKMLSDAYAKYTAKCVTFKEPEEAPMAPPPQPPAPAAGSEAPAAPETPAAASAVTDEATAAAAAAAAMEEGFSVQI